MKAFIHAITLSCAVLVVSNFNGPSSFAGVEGSISGNIVDTDGVAVPNAKIQLLNPDGKLVKEILSSNTGEFQFFPVVFGDYQVSTQVQGFAPYTTLVHVSSGGNSQVPIQLQAKAALTESGQPISGKEITLQVTAKRHLIQSSASVSSREVDKKEIAELPQGDDVKLPKLLASTNPGIVQGAFGQSFIRGNHANIQYQIDGVQLPDSPSNTFGDAFSPRNIDHMEVITGGIPSEYGERLAAVVNIVSKTGSETPGGSVQLNYGSYNTFTPHLLYGGSNKDGDVHYFFSAAFSRTDRGLDTPQPQSETNQAQGGTDAIHDQANGNSQFGKVDWIVNNENKVSFIVFNSYNFYQIPNYPSNFSPGDAFFQASPSFTDQFGNNPNNGTPTFNFVPSTTNDTQAEDNAYLQVVWKHSFSDRSFLQLAPYYKFSYINVANDLTNDLASADPTSAFFINGSTPSSFSENRRVNNLGLKADYSDRFDDRNLFKTGFQLQGSSASGAINVISQAGSNPVTQPVAAGDASPTYAVFESVYAQDDYTISKPLILNAGVRFDATQFNFNGANPTDYLFQPRIGLNYLLTENTKLHVFYGKLFQPAPAENLRQTFIATGTAPASCAVGNLCPYDIKAEKDDYYEVGVAQQAFDHVFGFTLYYKDATNQLDDAQLLNTSIAQPYNFATGYAYGVELSVKGRLSDDWSDFANYSYETAKGKGLSGGIFTGLTANPDFQYLDHVQLHTANAGITFHRDRIFWTNEAIFGTGLRTGANNSASLPSHYTQDTTVGYSFNGDTWLSKFQLSGDVLNIFNNVYPISISNGFNGSHYAAGRQFFVRLTKDL